MDPTSFRRDGFGGCCPGLFSSGPDPSLSAGAMNTLSPGPSSELRMLPSPSSVSSSRSLRLRVGDSDVLLKLERFISAREVP